jgi:hypothetical protein
MKNIAAGARPGRCVLDALESGGGDQRLKSCSEVSRLRAEMPSEEARSHEFHTFNLQGTVPIDHQKIKKRS